MSKKEINRDAAFEEGKAISELLTLLNKTPDSELGIAESYFAERLFAKAPSTFFSSYTSEELARVAREGFLALKDFTKGSNSIIVKKDPNSSQAAYFSFTEDCPFIISSTIECVRAHNLRVEVIFHPIIPCGSKQIAVTYLLLDEDENEVPATFEESLKEVLADVRLATSSFDKMRVQCQVIKKSLLEPKKAGDNEENLELAAFVEWLEMGSFLLLGTASWTVEGESKVASKPTELNGILQSKSHYLSQLMQELREDAQNLLQAKQSVWLSRLRIRSLVQRRARMHSLVISAQEGGKKKLYSLIGLFTYAAHAGTCSTFPLIRRKFRQIVTLEKVAPNSHDYKHIVETIDRMPLDEALSLDLSTLQRIIRLTIGIHNISETRVLVMTNPLRRVLTLLVVMGRDRYTAEVSERIRNYLEALTKSSGELGEYHIDTSLNPFARIYFQLPISTDGKTSIDPEQVEREVVLLSHSWMERVEIEVEAAFEDGDFEGLQRKYHGAFPDAYQALHTSAECVRDIIELEKLNESESIRVSLYRQEGPTDLLVIYRKGDELVLSKMLPVIEQAGLQVLHAEGLEINPRSGCGRYYIYRLRVKEIRSYDVSSEVIQESFCPGLVKVLLGQFESDVLNSLMLSAGLSIRQVALIRTYCAHLLQLRRDSSNTRVFEAIAFLPTAAKAFWECFEIRFDPEYQGDRNTNSALKLEEYKNLIRGVTDLSQDRILKGLLNLLECTVRTNYFHFTPAIAIKVASRHCEIMPLPKPYVEIYVRSFDFEGVHLRGGPVSRGGLRWSDRYGDFRNEVLGLMKTQRIKNVIIAPDGAKGGFVVRHLPQDKQAIKNRVIEAYESYIRALLSITDNRIGGKIVTPARVVAYDGDDPYLVVAADKGTASFSDIANKIAVEEYSFWLGDAFASGGSKGYSHKSLGITARGAWECVKRLFRDLGVDAEDEVLTAIGIGDMAGDVFGNGMILSQNLKVLAAFNHSHIFIDPSPDPKASFMERKRLFELPSSQWTDYKSELISKGGGVFLRFAKEIPLSKEMRKALGVPPDAPGVVDGETLISFILKAPVDLLWNGGIGTYVKSSSESNSDVNDGANDNVRVNSTDLRCRVVGEGGNLGFTQRARIEFALRGGKINTDAVDNSGGVDLSDHEVNLKILFAEAIAEGKLTLEQRDEYLGNVVDEVIESVLSNNRSQARSLSHGERRSLTQIDFYSPLIAFLHRNAFLNRDLEALPDDDDLKERVRQHLGLTRPELSTVMAGAKMWMKSMLLESKLVEDSSLEEDLLSYFPESIREPFRKDILGHPLAKNILALQIVNSIVDLFGMSFVYRLSQASSVKPLDVLKCCIIAERLLKGRYLGNEYSKLDTAENNELFISIKAEVGSALRKTAAWYLSYHREGKIADLVWTFSSAHAELIDGLSEILDDDEKLLSEDLFQKYKKAGLSEDTSKRLSLLPWIREALQILWVSRLAGSPVRSSTYVFKRILSIVGLRKILNTRGYFQFKDKWDYELLNVCADDMWKAVTLFSARLIQACESDEQKLKASLSALSSSEDFLVISQSLLDKNLSISGIAVLARKLNEACANYSPKA